MRVKTLVLGGMIAAAAWVGPGMATADLNECDSGNLCMWGNNDYNWLIGERAGGGGTANLSGSGNNQMDSWANTSSTYSGCMYADANGGGDKQTMGRVSRDNNVSSLNSDEVSSWKTNGSC
ncbi:peptidase inhibitor family I36 protein [Nonomuraea sp. NPDC049709]|uniref:peptidase inhibitor family I36 protein n=1 Tax=Nonomuraea sp. NPDC049709 TaxID=3154736 RepID=UPI00343E6669